LVAWVYKPQSPDSGEGQEESAERHGKLAY
jgi:hypothetical protein